MLANIKIVMVETTHPGNIGAAARAMKTMGLSQLVLVNPKSFPAEQALWRAAGAQDVLEHAQVKDTLADAIADCHLVVAASARQRRIPWPTLTPFECGQKAISFAQGGQVALVFGREDRGLVNEELQLCHYHAAIPANEIYPVLNVAAAVQVFCYEIRKSMLALQVELESENKSKSESGGEAPCLLANTSAVDSALSGWDVPFATQKEMEMLYEHMEKVLSEVEFLDARNPRQTMTRLRRLFNRSHIDQMEMNILRGILTAFEKQKPGS